MTKGAYTGAIEKKGLFEQSENGTIFLDEIQTLSLEMQSKLLRVLEYKVVRRVGGDREIKVNPRIITAVNIDPEKYMKEGKLKPDLFYRIAVITLRIPPSRERLSDIPLLVHKFIRHANKYMGSRLEGCNDEVIDHFCKYHWPGNVRELQHCIDHAAAVMDSAETKLSIHDLPSPIRNAFLSSSQGKLEEKEIFKEKLKEERKERLDNSEPFLNIENSSELFLASMQDLDYKSARQSVIERCDFQFHQIFLKNALKKYDNNVSRTAKELQISRQHLHKLMKQFKVER